MITLLSIAESLVGLRELAGPRSDPFLLWCLQLCDPGVHDDAVPWCSALVNGLATLAGLPRSQSLRARSWLTVGRRVSLAEARPGFDVVVFSRGAGVQPGVDVLDAPGHVAIFSGLAMGRVWVTGGNQHDAISTVAFPAASVLAVQRLREA